ncbi:hypothetical protein FSP39_022184, partial [Pinctada imbricata]
GQRLHMRCIPVATASVIYHKFFRENSLQNYDPYLVAAASLYLAAKTEEENVSLRDIVNVTYRTLHRSKPPLEMGEAFYSLRDSVSSCELFILRTLQFKVAFNHPHKYLLHYLKFLKDWFDPYKWESVPVARTAWALLRDSYHSNITLKFKPQHIAIATIQMALQCYGMEVPLQENTATPWWKVLSEDISEGIISAVVRELTQMYDLEATISS